MKSLTEDDICFNRHKGNPQSIEANKIAMKAADRQFIIDFLKKYKEGYSKLIARTMGKQLNKVSGRFSELKADGVIVETGQKMEGCAIYKLKGE